MTKHYIDLYYMITIYRKIVLYVYKIDLYMHIFITKMIKFKIINFFQTLITKIVLILNVVCKKTLFLCLQI